MLPADAMEPLTENDATCQHSIENSSSQ